MNGIAYVVEIRSEWSGLEFWQLLAVCDDRVTAAAFCGKNRKDYRVREVKVNVRCYKA